MKHDNDLDNASVEFKKQLPRAVQNPCVLWRDGLPFTENEVFTSLAVQ